MTKETVKTVLELNQQIERLKDIQKVVDKLNPGNSLSQNQGLLRCLEELGAVTSITPILMHLQELVAATLKEKQIALDNL